jgi:hypothetical protein
MRARADYGSVGTRVCPIVINLGRGGSDTMPIARDTPAGVIGGVETGMDNLRGPGTRQRQHDGDPQNVVEHGPSSRLAHAMPNSEQLVNEDGTRRDR